MEAKFLATIKNVRIKPGAEAVFTIEASATQVSEIIKMAELGQLNLTIQVSSDQVGKDLLNVIFSNITVGEPQNDEEDKEPTT